MRTGLSIIPILDSFTWPDIAGSAEGLRFYGAVTDININGILGNYDVIEFGYGSESTPTPSESPTPTPSSSVQTQTPTQNPSETPNPSARMNVVPGQDAGNVPGKGCGEDWIFSFELISAGSQSEYHTVAIAQNIGSKNLAVELNPSSADRYAFEIETASVIILPGASFDIRMRFNPPEIK